MATQSQTAATDGGPNAEEPNDAGTTAGTLQAKMTAEELRRFAAHLPEVSRSRGANKAQTAQEIAEQAPEMASEAANGGSCSVSCSCGLSFDCEHPQTARSHAKAHKSANPTHFPSAKDEETETALYGR